MRWPLNKVFVTQEWGVNEETYKRFGYKGHNGIDLRLHQGNDTPVYAPHDGIVKERRNDEDGYGLYLKIENEDEGSILAHFKEFKVNVNKHVKEGDLIAIGDNTGWSTGPHLHWGYYRFPRDRKNGYGGTIDPRPHLGNESMYYNGIDLNNHESVKVCVDTWLDVVNGKYVSKKSYNGLKEEYKQEKEILNERIKEEKGRYNDLVRRLAEKLDSQQNEPSIFEEISRALSIEWNASESKRKLEEMERRVESHKEREGGLREKLGALKEQKVSEVKTGILISELLRRLLRR